MALRWPGELSSPRSQARWALALLLVLSAAVVGLGVVIGAEVAPPGLLTLPVVLGALALGRREMTLLLAATAAGATVLLVRSGMEAFRPGNILLLAAMGWVGLRLAGDRDALGVPGLAGGSMLAEVRDRLRQQGELPVLPHGWKVEVLIKSAGNAGFAGDFLVSAVTTARLEMALVDVSGKGVDAGSRALLLSGALGGLLGAVRPEEFLPAANAYLLRQEWGEGFATAAYLSLDLVAGDYLLQSAGHPPAAQFAAGTGYWSTSDAEGPVLGILERPTWRAERGQLRRGDALLIFTDGIIEVPGRDLSVGIDKLLGEANRLVISTFDGGAEKLVGAVAPDSSDDRALVLLWRQ